MQKIDGNMGISKGGPKYSWNSGLTSGRRPINHLDDERSSVGTLCSLAHPDDHPTNTSPYRLPDGLDRKRGRSRSKSRSEKKRRSLSSIFRESRKESETREGWDSGDQIPSSLRVASTFIERERRSRSNVANNNEEEQLGYSMSRLTKLFDSLTAISSSEASQKVLEDPPVYAFGTYQPEREERSRRRSRSKSRGDRKSRTTENLIREQSHSKVETRDASNSRAANRITRQTTPRPTVTTYRDKEYPGAANSSPANRVNQPASPVTTLTDLFNSWTSGFFKSRADIVPPKSNGMLPRGSSKELSLEKRSHPALTCLPKPRETPPRDDSDCRGDASTVYSASPGMDGKLTWRDDPVESKSDWRIKVVHHETGQEDVYHAHRKVLTSGPNHSEYISEIFHQSDHLDGKTHLLRLDMSSVAAEVFPVLLDYMYGEVDVASVTKLSQALAVYNLAEYFEMPGLMLAVANWLRKKLKLSKVPEFLGQVLKFKYPDPLVEVAVDKCARNFDELGTALQGQLDPTFLLAILDLLYARGHDFRLQSESQYVAHLILDGVESFGMTKETFYALTDKRFLPARISPRPAIQLLILDSSFRDATATTAATAFKDFSNLQKLCIRSIVPHWEEVCREYDSPEHMSESLAGIHSHVLAEILVQNTKEERRQNHVERNYR